METNEIMTGVEVIEGATKPAEEAVKKTGFGSGMAMLIGGGLTLAIIAGGVALKFAYSKLKAKKEMKAIKSETEYYAETIASDSDEEIR